MNRGTLRVLYLQPAPLFGGAERQAALNASLLPEFGVDVVPLVGPGNAIVEWLEQRGVRDLVHSPNFPGGWPKQRGLRMATLPYRYIATGIRAFAEIRQLLRERRIDAVVASLPFAWIVGGLAAKQAGVPIVWRAGGERINAAQKAGMWLLTRVLSPERLLCPGQAVLSTFGPLVPAPAVVIPNGVDTDFFRPGAGDPSKYRPRDASHVIGYAARLTRAKRPQDFIAMAARLRERFPGARFLLGGEGSRRREFEELAERLDADNVRVLGYVSDMRSFLAACDVVVLPSGAEGCPNFVLEALAMGRPVVASAVRPVLELVDPGTNALTYPLGDVDRLGRAVASLLIDPDRRALLAARARERALELTARRAAAKLAAMLRALVAEHDPNRARGPDKSPQPTASSPSWQGAPSPPGRGNLFPSTPAPDPRRMD